MSISISISRYFVNMVLTSYRNRKSDSEASLVYTGCLFCRGSRSWQQSQCFFTSRRRRTWPSIPRQRRGCCTPQVTYHSTDEDKLWRPHSFMVLVRYCCLPSMHCTYYYHLYNLQSSTIGSERRRATCNRRAAPRSHHADSTTAPLAAHKSTSDL